MTAPLLRFAALALVPLALPFQDGGPPQGQDGPGVRREAGGRFGGRREEGPLHEFMEHLGDGIFDIEDALWAEGAETTDEQWAEHVAAIVALQAESIAAKSDLPRMFMRMPEEERPRQLLRYTSMMHELTNGLFELELTLLRKDRKAFRDGAKAMEVLEKRGHDAFKPSRRRGRGQGGPGGQGGDDR